VEIRKKVKIVKMRITSRKMLRWTIQGKIMLTVGYIGRKI